MSDLPLDETALAAAALDAPFAGRSVVERIVSTYLREARFDLETRYKTISAKDGLSDPEQRPVGPWVPVVQAESEEK